MATSKSSSVTDLLTIESLQNDDNATANNLTEPLLEQQQQQEESEGTSSTTTGDDNDEGQSHVQMSAFFYFTVSVVCVPMFLFGFNTGVLNAPESVIFPSHSVLQWSVAVSAFCAGGFFGANVTGRISDKYGRRKSLIVTLLLNLIFGILHSVSPNMKILIAARFGIGLAGGASTVLTPMYLSEISPREIRGSIGTLTQLSCVSGILLSILWAIPFCTDDKWRFIFLPIPVIAAFGILSSPWYLPESPRWLLINNDNNNNRFQEEAKDTMKRFRKFDNSSSSSSSAGEQDQVIEMEILLFLQENTDDAGRNDEDAGEEEVQLPMFSHMATSSFDETASSINREPPPATTTTTTTTNSNNSRSFRSYLSNPRNRVPLLASILFPIAQQLSGINAVFYYSTSFFSGVIPNPQTGTIIAFAVNFLATVVALLVMDKLGRRTLLSLSAGGMFVCCILLTLSRMGILPGFATVISVMLYISFFEIGLGCIPFFIASEMIEPEFLGSVQSFSMSSNWLSNFFVGIFFPYMDKLLGPYSFVPFAIVLLGTVLFSIFVLPETRGKTLREVMQVLDERQGPIARSRAASTIGENEAEISFV